MLVSDQPNPRNHVLLVHWNLSGSLHSMCLSVQYTHGPVCNLPLKAIGSRTRRMKVPCRSQQHAVMVEAVQNHTPEVLVIDEIGTDPHQDTLTNLVFRAAVV